MGVLDHDLRNPLNAISLAAETLLLARPDDEMAALIARRIRAASQRMSRLIAQSLDFAALRSGSWPIQARDADLEQLCRTAASELEELDKRGFDCGVQGDPRGCWDPDRILQLFSSLIGNALRHGAADVAIAVRIDGRNPDAVAIEVEHGGTLPESLRANPFAIHRLRRGAAPASASTSSTRSRERTAAAWSRRRAAGARSSPCSCPGAPAVLIALARPRLEPPDAGCGKLCRSPSRPHHRPFDARDRRVSRAPRRARGGRRRGRAALAGVAAPSALRARGPRAITRDGGDRLRLAPGPRRLPDTGARLAEYRVAGQGLPRLRRLHAHARSSSGPWRRSRRWPRRGGSR